LYEFLYTAKLNVAFAAPVFTHRALVQQLLLTAAVQNCTQIGRKSNKIRTKFHLRPYVNVAFTVPIFINQSLGGITWGSSMLNWFRGQMRRSIRPTLVCLCGLCKDFVLTNDRFCASCNSPYKSWRQRFARALLCIVYLQHIFLSDVT